jgi:hypothetical protein
VSRFSHELFRAFYSSAKIASEHCHFGSVEAQQNYCRAALNFGAELAANASPNHTRRTTQLPPVFGLDPNTDPGLAGETGLSRD